MTDRLSALKGTSPYNAFLFAPIGDEPGGMRLSVLSALARSDVDPWEEAARLSKLSLPDAQRNLAARLDPFLDKQRGPAAAESLAARLVALLPENGAARTSTATTVAGDGIRPTGEWVAWLCFAFAMVLLAPHHSAKTTGTDEPVSTANAKSPLERGEENPAVSGVNTQPDQEQVRVPAIPN